MKFSSCFKISASEKWVTSPSWARASKGTYRGLRGLADGISFCLDMGGTPFDAIKGIIAVCTKKSMGFCEFVQKDLGKRKDAPNAECS